MNRKMIITGISLMCLLSIGNMIHNISNTIYGYTPTFHLKKGAKVIYGEYKSQEQIWDVGNIDSNQILLMSTTGLGEFPVFGSSTASSCNMEPTSHHYLYCPTTILHDEIRNILLNVVETANTIDVPFLPSIKQLEDGGSLGLLVNDREFKDDTDYWVDGSVNMHGYGGNYYGYIEFNVIMVGKTTSTPLYSIPIYYGKGNTSLPLSNRITTRTSTIANSVTDPAEVQLRPFMIISNEVSFAAPVSFSDGKLHQYMQTSSIPGDKSVANAMQLRIKDLSLTAHFMDIKNRDGRSIFKSVKDIYK